MNELNFAKLQNQKNANNINNLNNNVNDLNVQTVLSNRDSYGSFNVQPPSHSKKKWDDTSDVDFKEGTPMLDSNQHIRDRDRQLQTDSDYAAKQQGNGTHLSDGN